MRTTSRRIRPPWPLRLVQSRPRMFGSVALGIVVTVALIALSAWRLATCLLVGWDIWVSLYLVLVLHMMATSGVHQIRHRAKLEDESQFMILALTAAAALASLGAIVAELSISSGGGNRRPAQLVLATLTIVLSWALIHTIFALHYAHEFYDEDGRHGLAFPGGDEHPDYWDFIYFSFVIGMTSQVSDVGITTKQIRRTVAAHGIVSFLFNAALLALTVNIAASAI
jgi:uncharacterized membrane protein